jgi:AraC-like DNA-binding protein/mannose-6-phosphate isomerase-like protein (cupin superfamily)
VIRNTVSEAMKTMATSDKKNQSSFWHAPELDAQFLFGRFLDASYDVHTHDTACFALLTRGQNTMEIRGKTYDTQAGEIVAIDADVPHSGGKPTSIDGCTVRILFVDMAYLRSLLADERDTRETGLTAPPVIRDAALSSCLYQFHRSAQASGCTLYRDERYLAFAARLFERHLQTGVAAPTVAKEARGIQLAREFLNDHLADSIRLTEIAEAANLPLFRLFRAFERAMGMTPHAYQRQARVQAAAQMIRQGTALSEVAMAVGFADQAHLTRSFRRMIGVTPGSYQAAFRG